MRNMNEPLKRDINQTSKDVREKARAEGDVVAFRRDKIIASQTAAAALLPEGEAQTLYSRFDAIQSTFVDEPRKAVEDANELVASAIQRLTQAFSDERSTLETQLRENDEVSTEDLRIALQRYRAFLSRLLSI
jgi:predicted phage tail protein